MNLKMGLIARVDTRSANGQLLFNNASIMYCEVDYRKCCEVTSLFQFLKYCNTIKKPNKHFSLWNKIKKKTIIRKTYITKLLEVLWGRQLPLFQFLKHFCTPDSYSEIFLVHGKNRHGSQYNVPQQHSVFIDAYTKSSLKMNRNFCVVATVGGKIVVL